MNEYDKGQDWSHRLRHMDGYATNSIRTIRLEPIARPPAQADAKHLSSIRDIIKKKS